MDVEIYDECTFATDPQIASGNFPIPENVVSKQGRIKLHGSAELNFSYLQSYCCDEQAIWRLIFTYFIAFVTTTEVKCIDLAIDSVALPSQEVADLWLPLSGAEGEGKDRPMRGTPPPRRAMSACFAG